MPNQLPKNQNQSNTTSFRNEKHLNLLDNITNLEHNQENRISNFILILSLFLGISVSIINYINITNTKTFVLDEVTKENIELVKSKETFVYELKKDIDYLNKYKNAKESIKIKQGLFYQEITSFITDLGKPSLESLTFTQDNNIYNFKIIFFSSDSQLESKVKEFQNKNKRFSNLKIETIEKLPDTKESKYTFIGDIDGR